MLDKPRYVLVIEVGGENANAGIRALRAVLKIFLRSFKIKVVTIEPVRQIEDL